MSWERVDECVGCAECTGCWRHGRYWMQCYCDECGTPITDIGYHDGDRELCRTCAAEAMFNANTDEDNRDYVRQCMATEGYDDTDLDDVVAYFDIPDADQPDYFDVTDFEKE